LPQDKAELDRMADDLNSASLHEFDALLWVRGLKRYTAPKTLSEPASRDSPPSGTVVTRKGRKYLAGARYWESPESDFIVKDSKGVLHFVQLAWASRDPSPSKEAVICGPERNPCSRWLCGETAHFYEYRTQFWWVPAKSFVCPAPIGGIGPLHGTFEKQPLYQLPSKATLGEVLKLGLTPKLLKIRFEHPSEVKECPPIP
jgi:hypothetical protein